MITEQALAEAIAECQGQRNPNRDTCMMLAAFYTIQDHLYGRSERPPEYSYAPPPAEPAETTTTYDSGSEFSEAIRGREVNEVLAVVDEAMDAVKVMLPRLYAGVLRKLRDD